MKYIVLVFLLYGCTSFDEKIRDTIELAKHCPGEVKIAITQSTDKETIKLLCTFKNEPEPESDDEYEI